jgi:glyceraldehyde-3-phosphate dehydrogenase (NADP+)
MATDISAFFPEENTFPTTLKLDELQQKNYLVDGELRCWDGPRQDVLSPVCVKVNGRLVQQKIGSYPLLTEKEALNCLQAAVRAYNNGTGQWPTMTVSERIKCILDFTYKMKEKRQEVVKLLMWEICKTQADAEKEFDRTVEYIYDTVTALKNLDRDCSRFTIEKGVIGQIRPAPLGVVLCMGPFNYPLNETFTTLIPALIMGNTVLFKPAKYGVLLLAPLLEAFQSAFPKGVVNTVYGEGRTIIGPIMATGQVDVLAFIGSYNVANLIEKQHPKPNRLKTIYGLNAKNPAFILEDADLELTVKECLMGALSYNGQRCTALKVLFVQESIAERFLARFTQEVNRLKLGMPWEPEVQITPLPEADKTGWLQELVQDAVNKGAKIINEHGGEFCETLFKPAVLYPVTSAMRLYAEEQFGPVVPVIPFKTIEEPVQYVVQSNYGQQVSIFSSHPEKTARLVDRLINQVCRVNINSQCQRGPDAFPFTGKKDSAEGTLSITDALKEFSIRTLVAAKETDGNKTLLTEIVKQRKSTFLSTDFIF